MSLGGLMWGSISFIYELYLPSLIPFGYFVFTILNFVGFYFSKNFRVVSGLQVFFSLLLPFLFQWLIGGFVSSGAIMLWGMVALTGAMTFEKLRTSTKWLIVYMIMVIATSLLGGYFRQYSLNLPPEINTLFFALNIGIVSAVVFGLFFFFKYRLEQSIELQIERQRILEERERELNKKNQLMLASEEELRQNSEELHTINESLIHGETELQKSNELLQTSSDELT